MKIAMASDHGALDLKKELAAWLAEQGHEVKDFGCDSPESCDYADFVEPACRAVSAGEFDRGIVLCTTGIGASITANKVHGIRCALCSEPFSAEMTRRHNNANVLALGAGCVGSLIARQIVTAFLTCEFEGGRHQRRIDKIAAVEGRN
ncbi:MAG: ribose 5-phosphate isomerase B [Oscillospiraceae bacterium]|nr:ribose 5-phosphate isomerase B [Oscillospiraceae bacterium]